MQIESLKVFCDLAETESFTEAAVVNGVTQSAVSQQIRSLERQFKCLLIERSKKRFRLTQEGSLLHEAARDIVQAYEALKCRLQEAADQVSGDLRIATIYSIGLHDLPPYLKRFLRQHPAVAVHVEYQRANRVYEDVLGNVVDLGLVAYPVEDPRLTVVELRRDPMVVICHPRHPMARRRLVPPKSLQGERFIAFEPDIPTRKALDALLRGEGVGVRTVMEFDNIETVKRAVEVEAGISIVPASAVPREVETGTLAARPFRGVEVVRPTALIHLRSKVLNPAMRKFIEVLRDGSAAA